MDGNFDDALRIVRELTDEPDPDHPVTLVNSVNPYRLEGQKTAAFEVCEDLGGAPDYLAIPVGNAGNITRLLARLPGVPRARASWRPRRGCSASRPRAPPRSCSATTSTTRRRWPRPSASAGPPAAPWRSRRATNPAAASTRVSDAEILAAYRDLARHEGIFCEPASAASVAGVRKAAAAGHIDPGATIVAVLTGLGLKDPDTAGTLAETPLEAEASVEAVRAALGW